MLSQNWLREQHTHYRWYLPWIYHQKNTFYWEFLWNFQIGFFFWDFFSANRPTKKSTLFYPKARNGDRTINDTLLNLLQPVTTFSFRQMKRQCFFWILSTPPPPLPSRDVPCGPSSLVKKTSMEILYIFGKSKISKKVVCKIGCHIVDGSYP